MREPHSEGVANHADPESCGDVREDGAEALTGASAGQPWSREKQQTPRCRRCPKKRKATPVGRHRKTWPDLARSKTLCTRRTFLHGNREIPRPATTAPTAVARTENPQETRR
jgi:hypothetical protein